MFNNHSSILIVDNINIHTIHNKPETIEYIAIYIHGTASSSYIYKNFIDSANDNSLHIAIDLPGYGISDNLQDCNFDNLINILNKAINQIYITFNIDKNIPIKLIGHSFGAYIAINLINDDYIFKDATLINPAGLLPTLGKHGYFWSLFFKLGFPDRLSSNRLLLFIFAPFLHFIKNYDMLLATITNKQYSLLSNLITIKFNKTFWNKPVYNKLSKINNALIFSKNDPIIPHHQSKLFPHNSVVIDSDHGFHKLWTDIQSIIDFDKKSVEYNFNHIISENYCSTISTNKTKQIIEQLYNDIL